MAAYSFNCPFCGGLITVPDGGSKPAFCSNCGASLANVNLTFGEPAPQETAPQTPQPAQAAAPAPAAEPQQAAPAPEVQPAPAPVFTAPAAPQPRPEVTAPAAQEPASGTKEEAPFLLIAACFIFPIVGFVLWVKDKNTRPERAKVLLYAALAGVAFTVVSRIF